MQLQQAKLSVLPGLDAVAALEEAGARQCRRRRDASGESTSVLSPQSVLPFQGPFPVATTIVPFAGSTAAPFRDQMAESLDEHELGRISVCRFAQSEFHTCAIRPVRSDIVTTWPWYGGASPI